VGGCVFFYIEELYITYDRC